MSIISSLNISQQGLINNQAALSVVSNNISNMNTAGYSKETVEFETVTNGSSLNSSAMSQINSIGGSTISQITRNRSSYLDSNYRDANTATSYAEELSNNISDVESLTNEVNTTGLSSTLSAYYSAADKLAGTPTDTSLRSTYLNAANNVCDKFNSISDRLKDLRTNLVGDPSDPSSYSTSKLSTNVTELNSDLSTLANLNKQISQLSSQNQSPNNLLDQRDKLIDTISSYVPTTVTTSSTNSVTLSINGVQMVQGETVKGTIQVDPGTATEPAVLNVYDTNGNKVVSDLNNNIDSGSIGAMLKVAGPDGSIQTTLNSLDTMAKEFARTVNGIQTYSSGGTPPTEAAMCLDTTGSTATLKISTNKMFVDKTNTSGTFDPEAINAGNISVSQTIINNPSEIATARTKTNAAGTGAVDSSAVGNTGSISLIGSLKSNTVSGLGNSTLANYLTNISTKVGVQSSNAQSDYKTENAVLTQATTNRSSKSGVNLDEELVDLIKYQRSYEASAKAFSTASSVLQTLMQLAQ